MWVDNNAQISTALIWKTTRPVCPGAQSTAVSLRSCVCVRPFHITWRDPKRSRLCSFGLRCGPPTSMVLSKKCNILVIAALQHAPSPLVIISRAAARRGLNMRCDVGMVAAADPMSANSTPITAALVYSVRSRSPCECEKCRVVIAVGRMGGSHQTHVCGALCRRERLPLYPFSLNQIRESYTYMWQ